MELPFGLMLPIALLASCVLWVFRIGFITTWLGVHPFIVYHEAFGYLGAGVAMLNQQWSGRSLSDNGHHLNIF